MSNQHQPQQQPTLSRYMRRAIDSVFPQYELLNVDSFLGLLKDFGIKFNGKIFSPELLEYYDRNDIIKPIIRINRRLVNASNQRYAPIILDNYLIRDDYLPNGLVQYLEEIDFQAWSSYRDGSDETAELYYHPAQFMAFEALALQSTVVSPSDMENIPDPTRFVRELQRSLANEIQVSRNTYR